MIALVKELKVLMAEKHLSPERASHFIRCATNSVNRWLNGTNPPTQMYRRKIKEGIAKIKEAYPEIGKVPHNLVLEVKELYDLTEKDLTLEEKAQLFDISKNERDQIHGLKAEIAELERLARKYGRGRK